MDTSTPTLAVSTQMPSSSWTSGSLIICFGSEQKGTQVSIFPQLEHLWDQKGETIKFLLTSAWIHTDAHRQPFFIAGTWKEDFKKWQTYLFKDKFRGSEGTQPTILRSSLLSGIIFRPVVQAVTMEPLYKWKPLLPPDECCLSELLWWWKYSIAISQMWLLNIWKLASVTEELDFH